ncbi:hypothetical protein [Luteolibacter sp. LG18]|uniref:hypothetical protein n=1 Tax=Luteolibacter sp. LG18 TaxID=2819286 RepID=UPI0030C740A5
MATATPDSISHPNRPTHLGVFIMLEKQQFTTQVNQKAGFPALQFQIKLTGHASTSMEIAALRKAPHIRRLSRG